MNSLATPPIPPHFHEHTRLSPSRSSRYLGLNLPKQTRNETLADSSTVTSVSTPSGSRKRKASLSPAPEDETMTTSPAISSAKLPQPSTSSARKRVRPNLIGRPLNFDRLLETLDTDSLRSILRTLVDRNPGLKDEVVSISPRPSVHSTLTVLRQYHEKLMAAFPLIPNPQSDYAYDRVRPQWNEILNALTDFTPHFLPPNETQSSTSLAFLDGATNIIHDLPRWDNPQYNIAKRDAYEEISRAWISVIREASKRAGGIQLQYGSWEEKLREHSARSEGAMNEAHQELLNALEWLKTGSSGSNIGPGPQSIRQQLFSGTYGSEHQRVRTSIW